MKMSNTLQRRVIIDELRKLTCHPTAEDLFVLVRKRLPRISLGTVYRNLNLIAEAGQILKMEVAGRDTRFDGNAEDHPHLYCEHCGAVEDVMWQDSSVKKLLAGALTDSASRRVRTTRVEFIGMCTSCAEKAVNPPLSVVPFKAK